ncbi:MAG: 2-C-methyl-D-erythritol 4-phosphate cytidylyltransferase [Puniceicoccales bacterium]|jgi:2-C-methyl-D-erythritol 4-phosphate cytidylyltransferase/2-C-methyl-D-erythritol 2,4-cyclodiphosphate synthase|nr:2-C-methyl-D-erythritol 4-phosphate cytidylyltransferase [Puniceicoccales bacterium]
MKFHAENHVILLAAGRGERMGHSVPKQFCRVGGGRPLLYFSLETLLAHRLVASVCVVLPEKFIDFPLPEHGKLLPPVAGGGLRHISVLNGLRQLRCGAGAGVLIHDSARPFLPSSCIDAVCRSLGEADAVTPALPIDEAILDRDSLMVVDRARYAIIQTPQAFRHSVLIEAFSSMEVLGFPGGRVPSCEYEMVRALVPSASAKAVPGDSKNFKVTHPGDLERATIFAKEMCSP